MKITRITCWKIDLTSHHTYTMAGGKVCDTVATIALRIDTDKNISGWGEVCPIPHYLPAYANGVIPAIAEMAPILIGADPLGVQALMHRLDAHLIGHPYAKSPIDIACWDITARAANLPLYTLLGGRAQKTMPLYHSITCTPPKDMAAMARKAFDEGIRQFQVKLGADWRTDVARLKAVRAAVAEECLVYGDWNCGASQLDAIRTARAVADLDIMLEQPCATLTQCAAVRDACGLAMKLDESAHDTASLLAGYGMGCMDAVAIKLSKFGGLSPARSARDLCLYLGAKMCIEDTWGSDITMAALLHLGASTPASALLNVCDLSGYVAPRLAPDAPVRENGRIAAPSGIGLGITPDMAVLGTALAVFE